jgi:hypothetical protein
MELPLAGEKTGQFRTAQFMKAAMEPSGLSPGISHRELREIEGGSMKLELLL